MILKNTNGPESFMNVYVPHFKVGSALKLSKRSVRINWSSKRIFKFDASGYNLNDKVKLWVKKN